MGEFDLIRKYFTWPGRDPDVLLGVGDDAAVLSVPADQRLVAAVDTIVEGIHFPNHSSAADIAWRALAVNLSDMAAMGATPRWFTLSLCMPQLTESWVAEFAESLRMLARRFNVELVGGDTVRGPLNVSVQILGIVARTGWLQRSGAQLGDALFVSGIPGEAAGGLQLLLDSSLEADAPHRQQLLERFNRPEPRVALGQALRMLASAAMDVSDGLLADLGKLCAASQCGAHLNLDALPHSSALQTVFGAAQAEHCALQGGDDYELLFTVPPRRVAELESATRLLNIPLTSIGSIVPGESVQCFRRGERVAMVGAGFDHFAGR